MSEGNRYGNVSSDMLDVTQFQLDPSFAIGPWLVCPSLHELWMMDSSDFSIKKTKMRSTSISLESVMIHLPSKKIKIIPICGNIKIICSYWTGMRAFHIYSGLGNLSRPLEKRPNLF